MPIQTPGAPRTRADKAFFAPSSAHLDLKYSVPHTCRSATHPDEGATHNRKGSSGPRITGSTTSSSSRNRRSGSSSGSSGSLQRLDDLADVSTRWLPEQPTFVVPQSLFNTPRGACLEPSDEALAERGLYVCYGKDHLSYGEVEQLMQLANLDISHADFRAATAVVWVYRYCDGPRVGLGLDVYEPAAHDGLTHCAAQSGSDWTGGGNRGGGGSGSACRVITELVGFACGEAVVLPPQPSPQPPPPPPPPPPPRPPLSSSGNGPSRGGHSQAAQRRSGTRAFDSGDPAAPAAAPGSTTLQPVSPRALHCDEGAAIATDTGGCDGPGPASTPGTAGRHVTTAVATVWFLAVHPSLRRQGLGRALLERLVSELRDPRVGAALISLRATSRSTAFYDRLGLVRDPTAPLVRAKPAADRLRGR